MNKEDIAQIHAVFETCYKEFEESGFDTLLIMKFLPEIDRNADVLRILGVSGYYRWRCLFEYFLRRIPAQEIVIRELLLERVRDLWQKQRGKEAREAQRQHTEKIIARVQREVFAKLEGYGLLQASKQYENEPQEEPQEEPENDEAGREQVNKQQAAWLLRAVKHSGVRVNEEFFAQAFYFERDKSFSEMTNKMLGRRSKIESLRRIRETLDKMLREIE